MRLNIVKRPLAFICLLYILGAFIYVNIKGYPSVEISTDRGNVSVYGFVVDKSIKEDKYILMLRKVKSPCITDYHGIEDVGVICYLDVDDWHKMPEIGSYIEVVGKATEFNEATNPGEFDMKRFYASKGYYFTVFSGAVAAKSKDYARYKEGLFVLGRKISSVYNQIFNESDAAIVRAMVIGDKGSLSSDIKDLFQNTGISHILSISGLHISIIGLCIIRILSFIRVPRWISIPASIGIMISYYFMTGMSTSTFRAVCMFVIMTIGLLIRRSYDLMTGLAIAALILIIGNPYILLYAGFWLSFMAVLGVSVFSKCMLLSEVMMEDFRLISKGKKKKLVSCINVLLMGASISVFSLPIVLFFYFEYPLYSIFLNLLVIPLMSVLLGLAILVGVSGLLGLEIIAKIFSIPCSLILWFYNKLCLLTMCIPENHMIWGKPTKTKIVIYYAIIFFIFVMYKIEWIYQNERLSHLKNGYFLMGIKRWCMILKPMRRFALSVVLVVIAIMIIAPWHKGFSVIAMDVGQGDGIVMQYGDSVYIFDGGSSSNSKLVDYQMEPCLKSLGISKVDYWFISHPDSDHCSGLIDILRAEDECGFQIKNVILPGVDTIYEDAHELINLAREKEVNLSLISRGDTVQDGRLKILCLNPDSNYAYGEDVNSYSEVMLVSIGQFDMLFTGDATVDSEAMYLQYAENDGIDLRNIDVLKVAHHGSNTSSSEMLLTTLNPKVAIISCGRNNSYGHPHQEIVDRLYDCGSRILRTDREGAITINIKGEAMSVNTFISTVESD